MEVRLLVSHVPIDTESFDLRFGVLVRKDPNLNDEQNAAVVAGYAEANRYAFFQDVEIWHTKCRVDNPLLCDGDGPIHKLRQWYAQFYVDRAEVPAAFAEQKVYDRTPRV
jgi:3-ketosteroid 9alpha-monooxygenase subunit A